MTTNAPRRRRLAVGVLVIVALLWALFLLGHPASRLPRKRAQPGGGAKPYRGVTGVTYALPVRKLRVRVDDGRLVNPLGQTLHLVGVNTSGTEDSCIAGRGISFAPLDGGEAASMAAAHVEVVRVPLNEDCWLGINGVPAKDGGPTYQAAIEHWVTILNREGIIVVLDLHLAAPGTYAAAMEWPMPDADHSITFWSQVATAYRANPAVMFDLFNEPFLGAGAPDVDDWNCWLRGCTNTTYQGYVDGSTDTVQYRTAGMQELVDAVRRAGASQAIMIGGLKFASAPCTTGSADGACMWLKDMPVDPLHNLMASFHNYQKGTCTTVSCWNAQLKPLEAAKIPLFTSEFGEEDCSVGYMDRYMDWADHHDVSYLAWVWQPTPPSATSCIPYRRAGYQINHDLLSTWDGTPSVLAPEGANYLAHLTQIAGKNP